MEDWSIYFTAAASFVIAIEQVIGWSKCIKSNCITEVLVTTASEILASDPKALIFEGECPVEEPDAYSAEPL
jgi:hypothetical protein